LALRQSVGVKTLVPITQTGLRQKFHYPQPDTQDYGLVGAQIRNIEYHCAMSKRPTPLLSVNTRAQPNWPENLEFASAPQITTGVGLLDCARAGTPASLSAIMDSATAIMVNTILVYMSI
jgi:hypothetical protein